MDANQIARREPGLRVESICKDYSVRVLDEVDFELCFGEIHALLGANGAGKSTLCKIISGLIPATSGSMTLADGPFAPRDKQAAEHCGVQIVQQELNLFPTLSVAENLFFGRFPHVGGIIRRRQLAELARIALDRVGLNDIDTNTPLSSLGVGQQQMTEIATALAFGDHARARDARKRQTADLPAIRYCSQCRGDVLENGEQCRGCGNPLWKFEWLTATD